MNGILMFLAIYLLSGISMYILIRSVEVCRFKISDFLFVVTPVINTVCIVGVVIVAILGCLIFYPLNLITEKIKKDKRYIPIMDRRSTKFKIKLLILINKFFGDENYKFNKDYDL